MGLELYLTDGQTPLNKDEKEGLLINTITTRGELNEFEQQNIEQALLWVMTTSIKPQVIFTEDFICNLHRRMYKEVWKWPGEFRKTNKNIGVDKWQITVELRSLLDDAKYWLENNTCQPDELALRFKHRLVSIHCFPNGNGRHSRLMADIIIDKVFRMSVFSWGAGSKIEMDIRAAYLTAIRIADQGNIGPLITFARS